LRWGFLLLSEYFLFELLRAVPFILFSLTLF